MSNYTGYIYLTTNLLNGKIYVGMHRVKNDRKDDAYIGSGVALKRAIEKYGLSNFSNIVLEWCKDENELVTQEKYWIQKLDIKESVVLNILHLGSSGGAMESIRQLNPKLARESSIIEGGSNNEYQFQTNYRF